MRLTRVHRLIRKGTLKKDVTWIDIQRELLDWSIFMANIVVPRYGLSHWKFRELENNFFGYLGQKIFESYLLELKIPHISADPIYKDFALYRSIKGRSFDFFIPALGRIEVKTTPPDRTLVGSPPIRKTRFMVNVERWQRSDLAVVIKIVQGVLLKIVRDQNNNPIDLEVLTPEDPVTLTPQDPVAYLCGYLHGNEVEKLPKHDFGQGYAYWTFLDPEKCKEHNRSELDRVLPLHPASDLARMLESYRATIPELKDLE